MKEKNLLMLLKVIHLNGNIQKLIREGFSFKQIADTTEAGIQSNLIVYNDNKISLSEKGIQFLNDNQDKLKDRNKKNWIKKNTKSQIPQISINDIFLPSRDSLTF